MKTLFKSILFCLTFVMLLSACDDKHEVMPPTGDRDNAEHLIEGVYPGVWTCFNTETSEETTATGSISFTWNEELGDNVSVITVLSDDKKAVDPGLSAESCGCNISKNSSGILTFWNVYTMNPFKLAFYGTVNADGEISFDYTITKKVRINGKPKEVSFDYSFRGKKQ